MSHRPTIVVVDHGSRTSQLVTRRLRTLGVFSELLPAERVAALREARDLAGVILIGGEGEDVDPVVFEVDRPLLAIGRGLRLLCAHRGAVFDDAPLGEAVPETMIVEKESPLLRGTPRQQRVRFDPGRHVVAVPDGFDVVARLESDGSIAAIADPERGQYAVQFHPESVGTEFGMQMLENFVRQICVVSEAWDRRRFLDEQCDAIARRTAGRRILCPVSGGVDSLVATSLVQRATAENLTAVFVNNGLMRQHEPEFVTDRLGRLLGDRLVTVDATDVFLDRLAGVGAAAEKRRVIEDTFVDVLESSAREHGPFEHLVQGTLYPDRVDAGTNPREHGATDLPRAIRGLPERLGLEVLEPLSALFREDVRAIGRELGLPADLLTRHPFPRAGLAIRVPGPIDRASVERVRAADAIFLEELRNADVYDRLWQAGCVLLPLATAGLDGEERTYAQPVVLRAVTSADWTTADWARIPDEVLARVSRRILREVDGITRVVYDISPKPPATIEWE